MEDYKTTHCLATIISDLRDDNKALDDMIHAKNNKRNEDANKIAELKADNKKQREYIIAVEKENDILKHDAPRIKVKELKAVNDDYNNDTKVHNEYADGLLAEIEELKAEVKRHEKQYHMLASSKVKEYKAEADEYFSHNPKSKGVRFHMIDFDEYFSHNPKSKGVRFHMIDFDEYGYDENEGLNGLSAEYDGVLFAVDCIAEIDNS